MNDKEKEAVKEMVKLVMTDPSYRDQRKEVVKEALRELIDEAKADFGGWTLKMLGGIAIFVVLFLYAKSKGYL